MTEINNCCVHSSNLSFNEIRYICILLPLGTNKVKQYHKIHYKLMINAVQTILLFLITNKQLVLAYMTTLKKSWNKRCISAEQWGSESQYWNGL